MGKETTPRVRILLADDHRIFREGLKALLEKCPEVGEVIEAADGREAVQLAAAERPDLIIMDVSMPILNGIEATRQILESRPEARIIALSMHADRRFVTEALRCGVLGYLLKDSAFEELQQAIRAVLAQRPYLSGPITEMMVKAFLQKQPQGQESSVFEILSGRERQVLQLLAEGKSTKEIAGHLEISVKTVETYRQQIMAKLNLHSIAELTRFAIREGLTPL
jgi:DNA-binding NarL/FixJ family response regulator